jgi:hypothetical protein
MEMECARSPNPAFLLDITILIHRLDFEERVASKDIPSLVPCWVVYDAGLR